LCGNEGRREEGKQKGKTRALFFCSARGGRKIITSSLHSEDKVPRKKKGRGKERNDHSPPSQEERRGCKTAALPIWEPKEDVKVMPLVGGRKKRALHQIS